MDAPKLKLRRLRILRFRNVVPGCELRFDDGVNVLLGKNGTGKTTLLALISCVVRSDFSEFAGEPFEIEFDLGPAPNISVHVANGEVEAPAEIGPEAPSSMGRRPLGLAVSVTLELSRGVLRLDWNGVQVASTFDGVVEVQRAFSNSIPSLIFSTLASRKIVTDRVPLWLVSLLKGSAAYRFDESLDAFRAMVASPSPLGAIATPPPAALSEFGIGWSASYVPSALMRRLADEIDQRRERNVDATLENSGDQDGAGWARLLGFAEVIWIADLLEGQPGNRRYTRFAFSLVRRDGSTLSHEHLSYGQKRMLALLYYMAVNPEVLIADEIVNGLHHEWIAAVMSRIRDRQAFLTSQNPLLFDYLTIDSAERAGRMFVVCTSEEDERGASRVTWRNLNPEEAARFHEDLSAGVEFPSEILLRRGLW